MFQEHYFYITGKEFVSPDDEEEVTDYFGNVNPIFKEQIDIPDNFIEEFYKATKVDYSPPFHRFWAP